MDFGDVEKGEKGGWVEKEDNLSQVSGNAWVSGDAQVSGDARVYGKLKLIGGYFYHIKSKTETIEKIETSDDYELLACNPKLAENEDNSEKKQSLIDKAQELKDKADELLEEANKL